MKSLPTEEQLQVLRCDLAATSLLLELLFVHYLGQRTDGAAMLADMSSTLKKQMAELTLPQVDPALSDHTAQMLAESMDHLLEKIRLRFVHPEGKAHRARPAS
jgi:hypothetical protein